MVFYFEEKDRAVIEARGMTIIEFKRILYRAEKGFEYAYEVLKEFADRFTKAWNVFAERFLEVVDGVNLVLEQIKEAYHYPTSRRYKIVKVFSKCTGTNIGFGWKITRGINRWLARSCC
ncbi:MAG: hypothetical protein K2N15_03585 [Lachnospiraceae bacterium]|nr:hypothetical protein [Lachnospiraceae bacterium]